MTLTKELIEQGWRPEEELHNILADGYPVSVKYPDGHVEKAVWHFSMKWLQTESRWDGILGWKPRK